MQYIKIDELRVTTNLKNLDDASITIKGKGTVAARKKYIDKNKKKWSDIKPNLWELGNHKCWYSEDKIQVGEGEIEHYRPKGNVCKSKHSGYWWLAFDWHNYRLSHPTCNKRRKDFLTKKLAGKGMYFPLKDEKNRAFDPSDNIKAEEPVLLDPTNPNDVKLILFNLTSGQPEPSPYCHGDNWKTRRAIESIDYYHLDEGTWNQKRLDTANAVEVLCKNIIKAEANLDLQSRDDLILQLKNNYANQYAAFHSITLQVLKEFALYEI